jgi:Tfp pilus assembly ATPase PilU
MLNRLTGVFESFQKHDVRYLVIRGIASILYGVPRATFDLDILIEATPDNAQQLLDSLLDAGLGTASLTNVTELLSNEITVFKDWIRIDVLTTAPGITFQEAWEQRETMTYQDQSFYMISKKDLMSSKKALGRAVDLEDVRLLELPEDQ